MTALEVVSGYASRAGSRARKGAGGAALNDDFCAWSTPTGAALAAKGMLLAIADGVSGSGAGRDAAAYAVRGLLADYYATPETWSIPHALDRVIHAINQWLVGQAVSQRGQEGLQTTLSALVLCGRRLYIAHVGDTRIYRWRKGRLRQLTIDHVWDRPEMQHVLTRAIGLDQRLLVDHFDEPIEPGDRFLLLSDGVWEPLGEPRLARLTAAEADPATLASVLVAAAVESGGQDDATALVARVDSLPDSVLAEAIGAARDLAPPRRLRPGEIIDGFEILAILHESRGTLLYKVRDREADGDAGDSLAVLKTLAPAVADDAEQRAALLTEEWLARRLISQDFPQALALEGRRSCLYYCTSFHDGGTLEQYLTAGRHFSVAESVRLGIRLLKGIGAVHRRDVLHCDIKPANLHLGSDGRLRIIDLGAARSAALRDFERGVPGTPSYMAPELIAGGRPDASTDLYAAGVTLYHLLTRRYPYGEIEPFQRPRFTEPAPATRFRPDIPPWLDTVLRKACARDAGDRFETAEEFLLALEHGERRPLTDPGPEPLATRDPLRLWQSIAAVLLILNLLLMYLLLVG